MKDPRMPYLSPSEAQQLRKALEEGTELPGGHPLTYGDHSALLAELRAAANYPGTIGDDADWNEPVTFKDAK